ncbi:HupE/UreJ family protein [Armatimonas sp.]|uniref:HupE/UreJ family protein n=1 Tax=Armatimonas sp. TaxID=1872638 RepID=UPI00286C0580|nr:HupE/UreJ family protein [Armatimonas sp.]
MRQLVLALLALFFALPARAHDPMLSGLRVIVGEGKTVVSVTTHLSLLTEAEGKPLEPLTMDLAFRKRVRLRFSGTDFAPQKTNLLRDDPNDLVTWQATLDKEVTDPEVLTRLYPEDATSKLVVSIFRDGHSEIETLLDANHPTLELTKETVRESRGQVFLRFVREGVAHIFGGPDHVCFVLGLLLLGGGLKQLLKTVTAFTLAHSITLTVAALGLWNPSPRIVEPLIALSLVAIAVENLRPRNPELKRRDVRPWFAFGFGLIHGFGFAGALAEVGLPKDALGVALAAFNAGVELGQALIVITVAPALAKLAEDKPKLHPKLIKALSVGIGLAGLYWLITRLP